MRAYIKKLQSKEEDTRKLILVGAMIVCMSVVVFIWILTFSTRLNSPRVKEQAQEDIKPFKLFSNSMKNTYNNMSASLGEITSNKKPEKQIDLIPVENVNQ